METRRSVEAPLLPSEARSATTRIKWGDLEPTELADLQTPRVLFKPDSGADDFLDFAHQRAPVEAQNTPDRTDSVEGKEGRSTKITPPHKQEQPSTASPRLSKRRNGAAPRQDRDSASVRLRFRPAAQDPLVYDDLAKPQRPSDGWRVDSMRAYHQRADEQKGKPPPPFDEQARISVARLHLASSEMQLRIESRRFEVAQMQLQVQLAKTDTAKAQLAVEKARNRGRQLDIELEQKQAASAAVKSDRDADRHAARLVDLDRQAAVAAIKKEAAQLQLDSQKERALSGADLRYEQQQTARAYIGLQQARLRNKQDTQVQSAVDADLAHLGVLPPRPEPKWQCAFDCGFSTADPAELQEHQTDCEEATDDRGFFLSWETGKWECDYCDFDVNKAGFTDEAAKAHLAGCLFRQSDGRPFRCGKCKQPTSVPEGRLGSYRISPWARITCPDCQEPPELTADAAVQTDQPGKRHRRGKGPAQQEGQDKEGPSSSSW
jgi:hypothetical protein